MQDCSLILEETVIIIYTYGRREYEDIRNNTKFELYTYVYIYMYIYITFLTFLYSYSITTLYHSVVSKNVFVFSMFDCL